VKSSNGTTLATVNLPNTGGNQTWQTVSANVNLVQGKQTLMLVSTNSQPWNTWSVNWMDFAGQSGLSGIDANTSLQAVSATGSLFNIFPNPVQDRFSLQVTNNYSGNMTVLVIDITGAVKKQFTLTKPNVGSTQVYLSIGDLSAGNYIIKVQMDQYSDTKKLVKQ
jgi:endoglucanase